MRFPTASMVSEVVNGRPLPKPAVAPFAPPACADPFETARVTAVVQPEFPQSARGVISGPVRSYVEVALDESGRLLDSWTYSSAGWAPLDAEALRAARHSSYSGAVASAGP